MTKRAMMPSVQRWLAPIMLAFLLVPSVGMLFTRSQSRSTLEKRVLAVAPALPHTLRTWLDYPRQVDAYLNDHFAFRSFLTAQGNRIRWKLGDQIGGGSVLRGEGDWLLLRDSLLTVTGGEVRSDRVRNYADFVCGVNRRLRTLGTPLLFSMAPSTAVIYPEALPAWVPRGRPSAYDEILEKVRACGVNAVDLRPPLLAAKPGGSIYYHRDTHWTEKGALIAYNRLVQGMGKSDWRMRPEALVWRRRPEDHSDLVAMSGASDLKPLSMMSPDLRPLAGWLSRKPLTGLTDPDHLGAFVDQTGHSGPSVLVIGDSYSADFLPPYFAGHVSRFAWIHQQWCGFDWRVFDMVQPDYVVLMPVDRWGSCGKNRRPIHMPDS